MKDKCTKTNIVLSKALDQSHETEVEWFSFTNSQARGIVFEYLRNNPTANCKLNVRKSFYWHHKRELIVQNKYKLFRVVCTKLDIYVFIVIIVSIPLLVDY